MEMINVKIDGISVSVPKGSTILEAARIAGIEIPTLCFMKEKNEIGACRICVVEANEGRGYRIVTACVYPVTEGMEVLTHTEKIQKARRTTLELILSTHEKKCLSCVRSTNCELQKLCRDYGVEESSFEGFKPVYELDYSTPHLVRDNNKCILCRRCVAVCDEQYVSVIGANNRGIDTNIGSAFNMPLGDTPCISCGQCTAVCPTGALTERDDTDKVWAAIADPSKHVVVHTAPSIRATLGECFGMPIGTNVEGKMVAALRRLGFDKVFDTDFAADVTIVEEANELVERINNGGTLPMITSCSPGWVKFCEFYYPDMIGHLSSCKSPQQMAGAIIKTYYADKMGIDPKDTKMVNMFKAFIESQKTDDQKAAEKETENQTKINEAEQRAIVAEAKAEAMTLGVKPQFVEDIVTLALAKMTDDSDLKTIIGEFKTKYPVWFGESEEDDKSGKDNGKGKVGQKGTGSSINNSGKDNKGEETKGIGARLAAQRKSGNKKSSYWGK